MQILVVDDDALHARRLLIWLRAMGFKTAWVLNGEYGIKVVRRRVFDLVFLDWKLLGEGHHLIREIERAWRQPRVVIMAREPSSGTEAEARQIGVMCFLIKPLDEKTVAHITEHTQRRLRQQE